MHSHWHKHAQFNTLGINGVRLGLIHKDSVLITDHTPSLHTFTLEYGEAKEEMVTGQE
jgi:hypothetical protein